MENFSKTVANLIWLFGVIGGITCGKVFSVMYDEYFNWSIAITGVVSALVVGALFYSLGEIQDSIDRNSKAVNESNKSNK